MLLDFGVSLFKGLLLGSSLCAIGYILDYTISLESQERIVKEKTDHFLQAHKHIIYNLIGISPVVYAFVDNILLTHSPHFSIIKYSGLLLTQNIGYFFVHKEMHRNRLLYKYHAFHHNFDNIVSPSIGNAVTQTEFCIAYIMPFVVGAFMFRPTELTYLCSIGTIGIGNLVIHTYELNHVPWIPGFVSPTKHIRHHEIRDKHYAAPIFDMDAMYEFVDVDS